MSFFYGIDRKFGTFRLMSYSTQGTRPRQHSGGKIMEFLIPLAALVAWVVLQAWVLPRFGVKT
jgi:hypothetical protein